jgi:hypothetical protein
MDKGHYFKSNLHENLKILDKNKEYKAKQEAILLHYISEIPRLKF